LALIGCGRSSHHASIAPPPREAKVSEAAARHLGDRISAALGERGPLRLTVTEEELTSYLALNSQSLPLRDITVWLTQGHICFAAQLDVWGRPKVQGQLGLTCSQGKLQVQLQVVTVDGRSLPRLLLASMEQAANDALMDAQVPVRFEQVVMTEGSALIVGSVR